MASHSSGMNGCTSLASLASIMTQVLVVWVFLPCCFRSPGSFREASTPSLEAAAATWSIWSAVPSLRSKRRRLQLPVQIDFNPQKRNRRCRLVVGDAPSSNLPPRYTARHHRKSVVHIQPPFLRPENNRQKVEKVQDNNGINGSPDFRSRVRAKKPKRKPHRSALHC